MWSWGNLCCPRISRAPRRSGVENIYHCCVHKTASQWIAAILAARETYQACGLRAYSYQRDLPGGADPRKISERTFESPFPSFSIVTPVYIERGNFESLPKPESWRAFAVVRDPRDVLVSWYFSWKHSHPVMGDVGEHRERLQAFNEEAGLCYAIQQLAGRGLFQALESWANNPAPDDRVAVFRYEDLIGENQLATFESLFAHCDIDMPPRVIRKLLAANSFSAMTRGRARGTEDVQSHLRKGIAGDWRNYFTPQVNETFKTIVGDLPARLGYAA